MAIVNSSRREHSQALSNGHTIAQTPSHIESGGYESDVDDEEGANSEDDDPLITPPNLDEANPFTNQQEHHLRSAHGSSEDLDKLRATTPNASLHPRLVRVISASALVPHSDLTEQQSTLRTSPSQTALGHTSDNEDQDVRRQKLLQVPIRVHVQIEIVTSEDDEETNP